MDFLTNELCGLLRKSAEECAINFCVCECWYAAVCQTMYIVQNSTQARKPASATENNERHSLHAVSFFDSDNKMTSGIMGNIVFVLVNAHISFLVLAFNI